VGLVAAAGGFRAAEPVRHQPSDTVALGRWAVAVDGAELESTPTGGGRLRVALRVTNVTRQTRPVSEFQNFAAPGAAASALDVVPVDPTVAALDPDVPTRLWVLVPWTSPEPVPATLELGLRTDARPASPVAGRDEDTFVAGPERARMTVALVDRRVNP